MKVLIQRVSRAKVSVAGAEVAAIQKGILLFVGVEPADGDAEITAASDKILGLRIFADDDGKMNLDVRDVKGAILVVSQFTLAGSVRKGRRPSFAGVAPPDQAARLVNELSAQLVAGGAEVECGVFGADMAVELVNDGPVTFHLDFPMGRPVQPLAS